MHAFVEIINDSVKLQENIKNQWENNIEESQLKADSEDNRQLHEEGTQFLHNTKDGAFIMFSALSPYPFLIEFRAFPAET